MSQSLYLADLITEIRSHTENDEFSETIGIPDSDFIRFINDAHYRLHSVIVKQHANAFLKEKTIDVVNGQEIYNYPNDIHVSNRVAQILYKHGTNDINYFKLKPGYLDNRLPGRTGLPAFYVKRAKTFAINPVPSGSSAGKMLMSYTQSIPRLDLRRASVGEVTLDSSTNSITSLTFNVSTDSIDSTSLGRYNSFSICDRNGVIKMKNIPYDNINTGDGVITITSGFTYEDDETIEVGDYVTSGDNSTTHSPLPADIERYIISYCSWKIFKRDSSIDSQQATQEVLEMEAEIAGSYADSFEDVYQVPLINDDIDSYNW